MLRIRDKVIVVCGQQTMYVLLLIGLRNVLLLSTCVFFVGPCDSLVVIVSLQAVFLALVPLLQFLDVKHKKFLVYEMLTLLLPKYA